MRNNDNFNCTNSGSKVSLKTEVISQQDWGKNKKVTELTVADNWHWRL